VSAYQTSVNNKKATALKLSFTDGNVITDKMLPKAEGKAGDVEKGKGRGRFAVQNLTSPVTRPLLMFILLQQYGVYRLGRIKNLMADADYHIQDHIFSFWMNRLHMEADCL